MNGKNYCITYLKFLKIFCVTFTMFSKVTNIPILDPIGGVRKAVDQLRSKVADRSHEMKETLKPLLGKVFHAVGNTGVLYRYRYDIS